MEGIMVLNTIITPIYSYGWNPWCLFFIIPILIGIYLTYFWLINRNKPKMKQWLYIGTMTISLSLGLASGICSHKNVSYDTVHQVIIDNGIDIVEFRNNYEIVEQVGITYMIRQK